MKSKSLSKAIILALTGTVLSISSISPVSAKSMYNTYNNYGKPGLATDAQDLESDGWVWGEYIHYAYAETKDHAYDSLWVGSSNNTVPFNYQGSNNLNWAVSLNGFGDSQEISQQNAFNTYGVYADIDTASGAWIDNKGFGWNQTTDKGLLVSSVTQA